MADRILYGLTGNEPIDHVEIAVTPRFKTSDISGDAWRTSAVVRLYRKGILVHERAVNNVANAAALLPSLLLNVIEGPDNEGLDAARQQTEGSCMQPGCRDPGIVLRRLRSLYCGEGHARTPGADYVRLFCQRHSGRGDCNLEDADANYETVDGEVASPQTVAGSLPGGAIDVSD